MKLVRCEKGHFYDGDKFDSCPHCEGGAGEDSPTVAMGSAASEVTVPWNDSDVTERKEPTQGGGVSLKDALEQAEPVSMRIPEDDDDVKTVRLSASAVGSKEPLVGWLVGLSGEVYGESFPLITGKNFIGRDRDMDVVLRGDASVSRQKHAIVIYEPKARIFLAQPGESRELFYLNDEVVLNNRELKKGDILGIGRTKLLFVPLCDGTFDWEQIKEGDGNE